MFKAVYPRNEQTIIVINMFPQGFIHRFGILLGELRNGHDPKRLHRMLPITITGQFLNGAIQFVIIPIGLS